MWLASIRGNKTIVSDLHRRYYKNLQEVVSEGLFHSGFAMNSCLFYPFQKTRYPPGGSGIVGGNLSMTTVGFVFLTCWANRDEQMSTFHYWTMSKWATLVGVEPHQLVWNVHVCLLVAIVSLPFANKVAGP